MSAPSCLRASMLCSCKERSSGSLISVGGSTWAAAERKRISHRGNRLILRIDGPGGAVGRIGNSADIGYQRLNVGLAERVTPRRHERGFVERRATVDDDGGKVGVVDLVESFALDEGMRLDFQVVVVRDALNRGLGIVA